MISCFILKYSNTFVNKPWSVVSRNLKTCCTLLSTEQPSNTSNNHEESINQDILSIKDFAQYYDKSLNIIDSRSLTEKHVIKMLMGKLRLDVANNLPADWNDLTEPIVDVESYDEPLVKALYKVSYKS